MALPPWRDGGRPIDEEIKLIKMAGAVTLRELQVTDEIVTPSSATAAALPSPESEGWEGVGACDRLLRRSFLLQEQQLQQLQEQQVQLQQPTPPILPSFLLSPPMSPSLTPMTLSFSSSYASSKTPTNSSSSSSHSLPSRPTSSSLPAHLSCRYYTTSSVP